MCRILHNERCTKEGHMAKEKLSLEQVCERLQIKRVTWRAYVSRGQAPQPDGHEWPRPGTSTLAPWWYEETIEEYRRNRAPWVRTNDA
jgi:hypothetical protein